MSHARPHNIDALIPRLYGVPRPALMSALQTHAPRPLTVLVAPAGYGKTTVLMQWQRYVRRHTPQCVVASLSLSGIHADPGQFMRSVIDSLADAGLALQPFSKSGGAGSRHLSPQSRVDRLVGCLAKSSQRTFLLIDNYHLAASDELDRLLHVLVTRGGPYLSVVLASRVTPDLPLALWKTSNIAEQIAADTLALSLDETAQWLGTDWSSDAIEHVHALTEGWAVAVHVAQRCAASPQRAPLHRSFFDRLGQEMNAYITEQILNGLPDACRRFLLETALLEDFDAPFVDRMRGRHDSVQRLQELAHLTPLLVQRPGTPEGLRYTRLLRDCLRQQVHGRQAQHVHRSASRVLAEDAQWMPAAIQSLKAGDVSVALNMMIEAGGWALVLQHGIHATRQLVRQFPLSSQRSEPDLLLLRAYLHAQQGEHAVALQLLDMAQASVAQQPRLARDWQTVRTLVDAYADRFEDAASGDVPMADDVMADNRLLTDATLGCVATLAALRQGDPRRALHLIGNAHLKMRVMENLRGQLYCRIHEARAMALHGHLGASRRLISDALAQSVGPASHDSAVSTLLGCVKAQHYYWQGLWTEADAWLEAGWATLESLDGWVDAVIATADVIWRSRLRTQGVAAALQALERFTLLAIQRHWPRLTLMIKAWRIDCLVQCGQLPQARAEAITSNLDSLSGVAQDWQCYEAACLASARIKITAGASHAAFTLLAQAARELRAKGLQLPAWRLCLMGLTARSQGNASLTKEEVAVVLEPILEQGLFGLLHEVGPSLIPALDVALPDCPALGPVLTRLRGWRAHPVRAKSLFSAQETRVIGLLAHGQSNKQIALALGISSNTVKFHLKHIFAKLAVSNRTEAVSMALSRGLLDDRDPLTYH